MKLYERLPDSVTVDGKRYKVDLDFRNVMRMLETLDREDIIPDARIWLAGKCVCKHQRPGVVAAVLKLLFGEEPAQGTGEKITDWEQDANLIRAAFRQEYGINLWRDKLHWLDFVGLLQALPEGNKYTQIIEIRTRPMPKANKYNYEERDALARAKMAVALKSDEKAQARKYDRDVQNIFAGLMGMVKKNGGDSGNE